MSFPEARDLDLLPLAAVFFIAFGLLLFCLLYTLCQSDTPYASKTILLFPKLFITYFYLLTGGQSNEIYVFIEFDWKRGILMAI